MEPSKKRGPRMSTAENTPEKRSHGSFRYLDIYPDLFTLDQRGASQEFIDRLGQDLLKWAKLKTSLVLHDFFDERFITRVMYGRWKNKDDIFAERIKLAKLMIGSRREKGALERKYDAAMVVKSMPLYDDEWVELEEWRSKLAKAETQVEQLRVLVENFTVETNKKISAASENDKSVETILP